MKMRMLIFLAILAALTIGVYNQGPQPQNPEYHKFSDTWSLAGIPNFWNVVSNLVFLWASWVGLQSWLRVKRDPSFLAFIIGLATTAIGSAYYHWSPDNHTLVWDRLPMTVAFMGYFTFLVRLRVSPSWGRKLLFPLIGLGLLSIIYWNYTESKGHGDLRPYVLVQFGTIVLSLVLIALFRGPEPSVIALTALYVGYLLAKLTETYDRQIFEFTGGLIGGHPVKHLLAGIGCGLFCRWCFSRSSNPCEMAAIKPPENLNEPK